MNRTKKIALLLIFCMAATISHAQFTGFFNSGYDGRVWFHLTNTTGYNLPISYELVNSSLGQKRTGQCVIGAGQDLVLGPNVSWYWRSGEVAYVYCNGNIYSWVNLKDPVAHKGGRIMEVPNMKCPHHDYRKDDHCFTYNEIGNGYNNYTICLRCRCPYSQHKPQK